MKIEVGKWYRTRGNEIAHVIVETETSLDGNVLTDEGRLECSWKRDGTFWFTDLYETDPLDLMEEISKETHPELYL